MAVSTPVTTPRHVYASVSELSRALDCAAAALTRRQLRTDTQHMFATRLIMGTLLAHTASPPK